MYRSFKKSFVTRVRLWATNVWYGGRSLSSLLYPASLLLRFAVFVRTKFYEFGLLPVYRAPVPLIVVGNITVGGSGKTPLVIWLAKFLKASGFKPGVICRGYNGSGRWPVIVSDGTEVSAVGDEAILLFRKAGCPVVVGPKRREAAKILLQTFDVNVVLSDDGLQHYNLGRDVEIVVVDGEKRFGNGWMLPAGPLREPRGRIESADLVVIKGEGKDGEIGMSIKTRSIVNIQNPSDYVQPEFFANTTVNAVSGIGHNESFFRILKKIGINFNARPFPDHYSYSDADLDFGDQLQIIMTEKDAVKCEKFASERSWFLSVEAFLPKKFGDEIVRRISRVSNG